MAKSKKVSNKRVANKAIEAAKVQSFDKFIADPMAAPLGKWSNLGGELLYGRGDYVVIRDDLAFPPTRVKYGYERGHQVNVYELEIMDGTGATYAAFEDSIRHATQADIAQQTAWLQKRAARIIAREQAKADAQEHETADLEIETVKKAVKVPAKKAVKVTQSEKTVTKVTPAKSETKKHTVVKVRKADPKKVAKKTPSKRSKAA
jgi:hypothetical protein